MTKRMRSLATAVVFCVVFGISGIAQACPSCKSANESDDRRPQAYMASILFMLAMPAAIFAGFGVAFWRASKRNPVDAGAMEEYLRQRAEEQLAIQQDHSIDESC